MSESHNEMIPQRRNPLVIVGESAFAALPTCCSAAWHGRLQHRPQINYNGIDWYAASCNIHHAIVCRLWSDRWCPGRGAAGIQAGVWKALAGSMPKLQVLVRASALPAKSHQRQANSCCTGEFSAVAEDDARTCHGSGMLLEVQHLVPQPYILSCAGTHA